MKLGEPMDLDRIPFDDKETYDLISSGATRGIFQLESFLAQKYCKLMAPRDIEDLSDVIAIIRPGALEQASDYIEVKNGEREAEYLDPRLEKHLSNTRSIILYQEQLISIVQDLAGFSEQEADEIRKIVGKKKMDKLKEIMPKIIGGFVKNGMKKDIAEKLMDIIKDSGSYSFNKSHSISYAINAYKSAYLKTHYPAYFFWANLVCAKNKQKPHEEVFDLYYDMKDFDIELVPPKYSQYCESFEVLDNNNILYGISLMRGMGETGYKAVKKLDGVNNWEDMLLKIFSTKTSKKKIEALVRSGFFDEFGVSRKRMELEYEIVRSLTPAQKKEFVILYQESKDIVESINGITERNSRLKLSEDIQIMIDKLQNSEMNDFNYTKDIYERQYLGINLISSRTDDIADPDVTHTCEEVKEMIRGDVCIVGVLESCNKIKTKNGDKMAFIELSDLTQKISNVVVFPDVFNQAHYRDGFLKEVGEEVLKVSGYKKKDSFIVKGITQA